MKTTPTLPHTFDLKYEISKIKNNCTCAACFDNGIDDFKSRIETNYDIFIEKILSEQVLCLSDMASEFLAGIVINSIKNPSERLKFIVHALKLESFNLNIFNLTYIYKYQNEKIYELIKNKYIYRVFPVLIESNFKFLDKNEFDNSIRRISGIGNRIDFINYFKSTDIDTFYLVFKNIIDYYIVNKDLKLEYIIKNMYDIAVKNNYPFLTEITNYILKKINHTRLPFYGSNYNARSEEEYYIIKNKIDWVKNELLKEKSPLDEKIMNVSKELININDQLDNLLVEKNKIVFFLEKLTRNMSRMKALEEIASLSPIERIKIILKSEESILYFPEYFIFDAADYFNLLTHQEIALFAEKLKRANTGVYKIIKKRLNEYINSSH